MKKADKLETGVGSSRKAVKYSAVGESLWDLYTLVGALLGMIFIHWILSQYVPRLLSQVIAGIIYTVGIILVTKYYQWEVIARLVQVKSIFHHIVQILIWGFLLGFMSPVLGLIIVYRLTHLKQVFVIGLPDRKTFTGVWAPRKKRYRHDNWQVSFSTYFELAEQGYRPVLKGNEVVIEKL